MPSFKTLLRYSLLGSLAAGVMGISAGFGALTVILYQVYFGDDSLLKKSTILAKINEETIIYTLDEDTRIGSFFESAHRRYVPIDEVPVHLINAFIAAENKNFYRHFGIDPVAIAKAFAEGVINRRFRRGGSTITQQTVKNILDKREHSFKRKFGEWIRALQLERLYSKRQIMEFYLNQFHVVHNGNGVAIAAQYYFNKDVRDLTLVEAAFIAGSVKGPSNYNPFIRFTPEARQRARTNAEHRKNYVLRRMFDQGWIDPEEFEQARQETVPFNRGTFRSNEVALVSLIRSQINKREILEALNMVDLSELNHAGLRIFTTIDIDLQRSAQLMMRRNLSGLETILQGFAPEPEDEFRPLRDLLDNEFYYGKVTEIVQRDGKEVIKVDFGYPKGEIPHESLVRYARLLDRAAPTGYQRRLTNLLATVKPGDIVYTEVRSYDREKNLATLELQKRPSISGGLIAIDKGEVRAVVSGFDPIGYNRAIFATRQPGSVFKALVFYAGMQLGWSSLDRLDNERRVFPYQGQLYYPRAEHDSPYSEVSMMWANIRSENLASVYLTANLTEKLNLGQFKELMAMFDLLPHRDESVRDYHFRVARKSGVQLDNEGIREYELKNAINDLAPDLIFNRETDLLRRLRKMWWGKGYRAELQQLYAADVETLGRNEQRVRTELARNNYQRHERVARDLTDDWNLISDFVQRYGAEGVLADLELSQVVGRFRVLTSSGNRPALGYMRNYSDENPVESEQEYVLPATRGRALNSLDVQAIWGAGGDLRSRADITLTDVLIEGFLPLGYLIRIQRHIEDRYNAVIAIDEPYDLVRYYHHHDFRIALGLNYLVKLTDAMGVFSPMQPVMSFALGPNAMSVAEVAKVYQTFIDGKIYQFYEDGPVNQLNFIRRIEDRFGNILFEPSPREIQIAPSAYSIQMREMMRRVITHGTGRRARGELYVSVPGGNDASQDVDVRIPAFGKTGTTNDYTTASFAGWMPYPTMRGEPLDISNSYVIASYVGYDLNQPMRRGGFNVGGAAGALPVWTDFAKSAIETKEYREYLDEYDLSVISRREWPTAMESNARTLQVDLPRGLILRDTASEDSEMFPTTNLGQTGEIPINEFALDASVNTVLRMPVAQQGSGRNPMRQVQLIRFPGEDEVYQDGTLDLDSEGFSPTPVDLEASGRFPGRDDEQELSSQTSRPRGSEVAERRDERRGRDKKKSSAKSRVMSFFGVEDDDEEDDDGTRRGDFFEPVPEGEQDFNQWDFEGESDGAGFIEEELW